MVYFVKKMEEPLGGSSPPAAWPANPDDRAGGHDQHHGPHVKGNGPPENGNPWGPYSLELDHFLHRLFESTGKKEYLGDELWHTLDRTGLTCSSFFKDYDSDEMYQIFHSDCLEEGWQPIDPDLFFEMVDYSYLAGDQDRAGPCWARLSGCIRPSCPYCSTSSSSVMDGMLDDVSDKMVEPFGCPSPTARPHEDRPAKEFAHMDTLKKFGMENSNPWGVCYIQLGTFLDAVHRATGNEVYLSDELWHTLTSYGFEDSGQFQEYDNYESWSKFFFACQKHGLHHVDSDIFYELVGYSYWAGDENPETWVGNLDPDTPELQPVVALQDHAQDQGFELVKYEASFPDIPVLWGKMLDVPDAGWHPTSVLAWYNGAHDSDAVGPWYQLFDPDPPDKLQDQYRIWSCAFPPLLPTVVPRASLFGGLSPCTGSLLGAVWGLAASDGQVLNCAGCVCHPTPLLLHLCELPASHHDDTFSATGASHCALMMRSCPGIASNRTNPEFPVMWDKTLDVPDVGWQPSSILAWYNGAHLYAAGRWYQLFDPDPPDDQYRIWFPPLLPTVVPRASLFGGLAPCTGSLSGAVWGLAASDGQVLNCAGCVCHPTPLLLHLCELPASHHDDTFSVTGASHCALTVRSCLGAALPIDIVKTVYSWPAATANRGYSLAASWDTADTRLRPSHAYKAALATRRRSRLRHFVRGGGVGEG